MVGKDTIEAADIPAPYNPEAMEIRNSVGTQFFAIEMLHDAQQSFEKEFIKTKLRQHQDDIARTAEAIGVDVSFIRSKLNGK